LQGCAALRSSRRGISFVIVTGGRERRQSARE
jgi:hypothetical protein